MKAWTRSASDALDWLGVRILVILGGLAVPFVIVQPMLWRTLFKEPPPTTTTDLGAVMSLLVTLLTFALAAYGLVAYRSIRRRLESELARQLELRLSAGLKPALKTMHLLTSQNAYDRSLRAWEQYENDLWFKKHSYDASFERSETFQALVNEAILGAELALEHADAIESDDEFERASNRYHVINSLAYHLATRRDDFDKTRAFELLSTLDELMPLVTEGEFGRAFRLTELLQLAGEDAMDEALILNKDVLETLAWVYMRFPDRDPSTNEITYRPAAIQVLQALLTQRVHPDIDRHQYLAKYKCLFGLELVDESHTPDEGPLDIEDRREVS